MDNEIVQTKKIASELATIEEQIITTSERLEAAYRNLDRQIYWVGNADNKALIFLTFNSLLAGILASNAISFVDDFKHIHSFVSQAIIIIATGLFLTAFIFSLIYLIRVLFPDTNERVHDRGKGSLFFFGTISGMNQEDFVKDSRNLSIEDIERELLEQTFVNAKIVSSKFRRLKRSVILLMFALSFLGIAVVTILIDNTIKIP